MLLDKFDDKSIIEKCIDASCLIDVYASITNFEKVQQDEVVVEVAFLAAKQGAENDSEFFVEKMVFLGVELDADMDITISEGFVSKGVEYFTAYKRLEVRFEPFVIKNEDVKVAITFKKEVIDA